MKLAIRALIKYLAGLLLVGALLFLPAGTLSYAGGWLFIGLLFSPMLALGVVLLFKSPSLLEKRLSVKEKENTQKGVVGVSALLFLAGFIVAGLDHRFGWSAVPTWVVIVASAVLLASYALYAEVMRENAYLSVKSLLCPFSQPHDISNDDGSTKLSVSKFSEWYGPYKFLLPE